jgi:hypothetical protein
MSDGGKGSKPRPLSVDKEKFDNNWNTIFGNRGNDYQDVLSTEDCILDTLEKIKDGSNSDNSI